MSAPCSNGRIRYGVAIVLSTISGTPASCARSGDLGDVQHVALRVADGLGEEGLRVLPGRRAPLLGVVLVLDEGDLDAELRQRVVEQVVRAAVQARRGDDVVARLGHVQDGQRLGGLPGGEQQRADAALERGDALLDHVLRRVHDAGVDVAGLGEAEEVRGVIGVPEHVRGGRVDRQGAAPRSSDRVAGPRGSGGSRSSSRHWSWEARPFGHAARAHEAGHESSCPDMWNGTAGMGRKTGSAQRAEVRGSAGAVRKPLRRSGRRDTRQPSGARCPDRSVRKRARKASSRSVVLSVRGAVVNADPASGRCGGGADARAHWCS